MSKEMQEKMEMISCLLTEIKNSLPKDSPDLCLNLANVFFAMGRFAESMGIHEMHKRKSKKIEAMMAIEIKEVSKDDLEKMISAHYARGKILGFKTDEEYDEYIWHAAEGLIKFGGSFAVPLGHALAHADSINKSKIIFAFRAECDEHAELFKKWLKQRDQND